MRVLSIDPAYSEKGSKTGFALCHDLKLVDYGVMSKAMVDDPNQVDFLLGQCEELVVEDQFYYKNIETLKSLVYARDLWIVPARWYKSIKKISLIKPQQWMKALTRHKKGYAKRDPDGWESYVKLRWGLDRDLMPDSIAAICILSYYLDHRN